MSGRLLVPFIAAGGPIVGPTGQPLTVSAAESQSQPKTPTHPVPWVTAVFEQYPAGVFGLVQILEEVPGADGVPEIKLLKTEMLMPNIGQAMKKARAMVLDRVRKTQGKNGKSHLHVLKKS